MNPAGTNVIQFPTHKRKAAIRRRKKSELRRARKLSKRFDTRKAR